MIIARIAMFMGHAGIGGWPKIMNLETFNDKILRLLKRWSHLGEKTDVYETQYIGHYDKETPLAYLHRLYKSGTIEYIQGAEQALDIEFPKQFRDFLKLFNGAGFFSPAGFDIFGVDRKEYLPDYETRPWMFPSNIVDQNTLPWLKALHRNALVIGKDDGINAYIIYLTDDGTIVEYDPFEPDDLSTQWPSFDDWLISKVENLFIEHDDNGEMLEVTGTVH